jgi:hypothetical protein
MELKMATKTSAKNGQAEQSIMELDADEMREQLGIAAIEKELSNLRGLLSEILTYINQVDLSVQELGGDPVVTEIHRYNVREGGKIDLSVSRPSFPSNLTKDQPSLGAVKPRGK